MYCLEVWRLRRSRSRHRSGVWCGSWLLHGHLCVIFLHNKESNFMPFACVFISVGAHMCPSCACTCAGQKITLVFIPQMPSSQSFRTNSLTSLEFPKSTRLTGQQAERSTCLCLPGLSVCIPMPDTFEFWGLNLVSCPCKVNTSPTESHAYFQQTFFENVMRED